MLLDRVDVVCVSHPFSDPPGYISAVIGSEASVREASGTPNSGGIVVLPVVGAIADVVRRPRHLWNTGILLEGRESEKERERRK